jgi:hypothetical protein
MHHNKIIGRCLIVGIGLMMAAFAAERVVVCEELYQET